MNAFRDPAVRLVDLIDYQVVAAHPTLLTPSAEAAVLANVITARTGLFTLHAPIGIDFAHRAVDPVTELPVLARPPAHLPGPASSEPRGAY